MELSGRVAVVTGGASGIGREICLVLAARGAQVVVADINAEGAADTVTRIEEQGGEALAVQTDVSERASVRAMIDQTVAAFGRLDILVNDAAICPMTPFEQISDEQWERTMAVNLRGPFLCSQEAVKIMREQGYGRIISISSVAGKQGSIRSGTDYAASKGGVIAMTLSMARIYAGQGITANVVAPGTIHSEMTRDWPEEFRRSLAESTPVGHLGEPHDVAIAVAFLASDEASFITGEVLDVNGGILMD